MPESKLPSYTVMCNDCEHLFLSDYANDTYHCSKYFTVLNKWVMVQNKPVKCEKCQIEGSLKYYSDRDLI